MSVCDSLSNGSLTDSLSLQMVELYCPALQNVVALTLIAGSVPLVLCADVITVSFSC